MEQPRPDDSEEPWTPRTPFSERALPSPETPESVGTPDATDTHDSASKEDFDDVSTGPIPLPASIPPVRKAVRRTFEPLTMDELTDEQVFEVRALITAICEAERIRTEKQKRDRPEPYIERFYIWKLLFELMALTGIVGIIVAVVILLLANNIITGSGQELASGLLLLTVLTGAWFGYRMVFDWNHTILFSNVEETGLRRPRKRWLLLNEKSQTVETASLKTKDATRGNFASFFNLNCWRVSLDTPAQNDDFLKDLTFVRNGSQLKQVIRDNQSYLN